MIETAWHASRDCRLFEAVLGAVESGRVDSRIEPAIRRMLDRLRHSGSADQVRALAEVSLRLTQLELASRSGDAAALEQVRLGLEQSLYAWLVATPICGGQGEPLHA